MINNIYIGSTKADTYYYGSDQVDRIYSEDVLVYQKEDEYVFTTDTPTLSFGYDTIDMQVPLIDSLKNGKEQPYDFAIATQQWVHVDMQYSPPDEVTGEISTTAEITVSNNTSVNSRLADVSFMQRESGKILTITILQSGGVEQATLTPTNLFFDAASATKYLKYTPENAQITIVNNSSWITTYKSVGEIEVKVYANLNTTSRNYKLNISVDRSDFQVSVVQGGRIVLSEAENTPSDITQQIELETKDENN